jgi:hypothetical protein
MSTQHEWAPWSFFTKACGGVPIGFLFLGGARLITPMKSKLNRTQCSTTTFYSYVRWLCSVWRQVRGQFQLRQGSSHSCSPMIIPYTSHTHHAIATMKEMCCNNDICGGNGHKCNTPASCGELSFPRVSHSNLYTFSLASYLQRRPMRPSRALAAPPTSKLQMPNVEPS